MGFFENSDGSEIEATTEVEAGGLQPIIPAGTKLLCAIAGVTVEPESQYNNEHIKIQLHVVEKGPYKDFTVNHKLQVNDDNDKKRDKHLKILLTYDNNCKGNLQKADKAGKNICDAGILSRALNGGEIMATFAIWTRDKKDAGGNVVTDTNGKPLQEDGGNWVSAIAPKSKKLQDEDKQIIKQAEEQKQDDFEDDIDF